VGWLYLLAYGLNVWNINKDAAMPNTVRAIDPISYRDRYYFCVRNQILGAKEILISLSLTEPNETVLHCTKWNQTNLK